MDSIYKPFIFARYSLFLKSNKNEERIFPVDEEYGMLSFFNVSTPLWSEVAMVLMLSDIIAISYNERLFVIGLLLVLNYGVSRIIIRRLKKRDYVSHIIKEFDSAHNSKYNSFSFCLFLLFIYTVVPIAPVVLYFMLQWSCSGASPSHGAWIGRNVLNLHHRCDYPSVGLVLNRIVALRLLISYCAMSLLVRSKFCKILLPVARYRATLCILEDG